MVTDTVILVDDDSDFLDEMSIFLDGHGIQCRLMSDADQLLPELAHGQSDILVLDQNLGRTTGMAVLHDVRKVSQIPCIILTGLQDPIDRILGLELGADDYISKSAMPREILARIRAVLRRARPAGPPDKAIENTDANAIGWDFRIAERELYRPDGERCHLTSAEFGLLHVLIEAYGQPVDRDVLTERVFNRPYRAGDRGIDGLVVKVRRKVEPDPAHPTVIKSARQQGYIFTGFTSVQAA